MTTTTITRGSEWSKENLYDNWGDIDSKYDSKKVEQKLGNLVLAEFAANVPSSISWIPYTSEVIGDVNDDYSAYDFTEILDQARAKIWEMWCNGDIDIEDCLIEQSSNEQEILKEKIIDKKYKLYIKKGKYGNQMFIEEHEVPGLHTDSMESFCEQFGITQQELADFADGFDIWD